MLRALKKQKGAYLVFIKLDIAQPPNVTWAVVAHTALKKEPLVQALARKHHLVAKALKARAALVSAWAHAAESVASGPKRGNAAHNKRAEVDFAAEQPDLVAGFAVHLERGGDKDPAVSILEVRQLAKAEHEVL